MELEKIYQPISEDLASMEEVLHKRLTSSKYESVKAISSYPLQSGGKRLRPALVLLSARVIGDSSRQKQKAINIAAAMELIHMASLIHDDVIDHSKLRHAKPTVNSKRGEDVAIALGDYLHATASELIATCSNPEVLECISLAVKTMCEGELLQVCERDNLNLKLERYMVIIKKKTATLFATACQSGGLIFGAKENLQKTLKDYGFNFGLAFQMVDDCLDFVGKKKSLGKSPGTDFKLGELTIPILSLISEDKEAQKVQSLMESPDKDNSFDELRDIFINSEAFTKTKKEIFFYLNKAKESISDLSDSCFKESLTDLTDYVAKRIEI